jgi:hypothetical protein
LFGVRLNSSGVDSTTALLELESSNAPIANTMLNAIKIGILETISSNTWKKTNGYKRF